MGRDEGFRGPAQLKLKCVTFPPCGNEPPAESTMYGTRYAAKTDSLTLRASRVRAWRSGASIAFVRPRERRCNTGKSLGQDTGLVHALGDRPLRLRDIADRVLHQRIRPVCRVSRGKGTPRFVFSGLLLIAACWDLAIFLVMLRNDCPAEVLFYQNIVTYPILFFPAFVYHFSTAYIGEPRPKSTIALYAYCVGGIVVTLLFGGAPVNAYTYERGTVAVRTWAHSVSHDCSRSCSPSACPTGSSTAPRGVSRPR